jgi:hypothetical protein
MIEVRTVVNGRVVDTAEAETPEAARFTARVLREEAAQQGAHFRSIVCQFFVDGNLVSEKKGTEL